MAVAGDDATDISLPPLQEVLHGGRGFVVVEWRLSSLESVANASARDSRASEVGGGGGTPQEPRGRSPTPYLSSASPLQRHYRIPPWFELEVPIAKLKRSSHSYAHGGFLGLAASMMADAEWRAILASEDPASAARAAPLWAAAMANNNNGVIAASAAASAIAAAVCAAAAAPGAPPPAAAAAAAANLPQQPLPPPPSQRSRLVSAAAERALLSSLENSPVLCAFGMQRYGCTLPGGCGGASRRETGDGGGGKRSGRKSAAGARSLSIGGGGNGGGGGGARPWAVAAAAATRARAGSPTPPPSPSPGRADGGNDGEEGPSSPPPLRSTANRNLVGLGGGRKSIDLPPSPVFASSNAVKLQQQHLLPVSPFRLQGSGGGEVRLAPLPPPATCSSSSPQARPPTTLGASSSSPSQQLLSLSSGRPVIIRPPSLVDLSAARAAGGGEEGGEEASDSDAGGSSFFSARIARVLSGAIFSPAAAVEAAVAAAGAAVVPDVIAASSVPASSSSSSSSLLLPGSSSASASASASAATPRRIGSAGGFRRGSTGRLVLAGEGFAEAGDGVAAAGVGVGGIGGAILEEPQDAGGLEWGGPSSGSSSSDPSSSDSDTPVVFRRPGEPRARRERNASPSAAPAGRIPEEREQGEEERPAPAPAPAPAPPSPSSSSSEGEDDELHHSDDDDEEVTGAWPESTSPGAARYRLASHEASGLARLRAAALAANASSAAATASDGTNGGGGSGNGNGSGAHTGGAAAPASASGFTTPLASERWRPGQVNRYGYAPCGLEWDCWIDPAAPSDLGGASVDHGTPGALVAQAVATSLPSLGLGAAVARAAGSRRILRDGISPAAWLTRFGRAVNAAVSGDPRRPLPLLGGGGSGGASRGGVGSPPADAAPLSPFPASPSSPPAEIGFSYRLNVRVTAGRGAIFAEAAAGGGGAAAAAAAAGGSGSAAASHVPLSTRSAARLYVRLSVRGSTPLPRLRTPPGSARGAGAAENARVSWLGPALSLWPLAAPLAGASLRIEVRRRGSSVAASAAGGGDARLGSAELSLSPALVVRPGEAPPESQWISLESKEAKEAKKKKKEEKKMRERKEKGGGGNQAGGDHSDDDEEEEEEGEEEEGGNAAKSHGEDDDGGDGDDNSVAGGEPALDLRGRASAEGAPLLGASAGGGGGDGGLSSSELRQRRRGDDGGESSRLLSQPRSPSPEPRSSSSRQLRRFDEFGFELDDEGGDVVVGGGEGEDGEEELDYDDDDGDEGGGRDSDGDSDGGEGDGPGPSSAGRAPSSYYEAPTRAKSAAAAAAFAPEDGLDAFHASRNDARSEVRVWLSLEPVSHLDALVEAGVERAAAQTCLALLSGKPGGLFLDVKSAYSSAEDVQMFAGALSGLGIHVKGVLSFNKKQVNNAPPSFFPSFFSFEFFNSLFVLVSLFRPSLSSRVS